jgi:hypothetical protein
MKLGIYVVIGRSAYPMHPSQTTYNIFCYTTVMFIFRQPSTACTGSYGSQGAWLWRKPISTL